MPTPDGAVIAARPKRPRAWPRRARKQFDAGYIDRVELVGARLEHLAAERNALALRVESQAALGALEDALQAPLVGGPLPPLAGERASADAASGDLARR